MDYNFLNLKKRALKEKALMTLLLFVASWVIYNLAILSSTLFLISHFGSWWFILFFVFCTVGFGRKKKYSIKSNSHYKEKDMDDKYYTLEVFSFASVFWLIYELCLIGVSLFLTIHFKNGLWMALVYFASKEYPAFRF